MSSYDCGLMLYYWEQSSQEFELMNFLVSDNICKRTQPVADFRSEIRTQNLRDRKKLLTKPWGQLVVRNVCLATVQPIPDMQCSSFRNSQFYMHGR
jgi:hypothetical protein